MSRFHTNSSGPLKLSQMHFQYSEYTKYITWIEKHARGPGLAPGAFPLLAGCSTD